MSRSVRQPDYTDTSMNSAETIRAAMAGVLEIRQLAAQDPALQRQLHWVKSFQSRRFGGTYSDLLQSRRYAQAANFFLEELYGERDYASRDAQFSRIAKALQTYFPDSVVATAVSLAKLHALTEAIDFEMARIALAVDAVDEADRYLQCWRMLGRESDRNDQLTAVLAVGDELSRLTRIRGLRLALRMMRGPARAAGLEALQQFLEAGFDTFAEMAHQQNAAQEFLQTIRSRETIWIERLFTAPETVCAQALRECLAGSAA